MVFAAMGELALRATDVQYPRIVHFPHCLRVLTEYRKWRASEGEPRQWLFDLVMSFWSHSMGGGATGVSFVRGKPLLSYMANRDYTVFHFLAYLATYWSPHDIVFRTLSTPRHPLRLLCISGDALDEITTLIQLVDAGFKSFPNEPLLPLISGILLFNTGSVVRCLDQRCRGRKVKSFLSEPGSGVTRGVTLAVTYCMLGRSAWRGRHRDRVLVVLSWLYVSLSLAEDSFGFDAFARLHEPGLAFLKLLQRAFSLGTAPKTLRGQ